MSIFRTDSQSFDMYSVAEKISKAMVISHINAVMREGFCKYKASTMSFLDFMKRQLRSITDCFL